MMKVMIPEPFLERQISPKILLPVALVCLMRLRSGLANRKKWNGDNEVNHIKSVSACQAPLDPRVTEAIEKELDCRPQYILDVGSGLGNRARELANHFNCIIVALEVDSSLSTAAARQTRIKKMEDKVWHVRSDSQMSVDPQDIIDCHSYDAVIVSSNFARRKGVLAWAAIALREGGVMLVEGDLGVYGFMKEELDLEFVRVCRGGTLESLEYVHRNQQHLIADHASSSANLPSCCEIEERPFLLLCGRRTSSQAPLRVRPRTLSAITFAPPQVRTRRFSSLGGFEKPRVERHLNKDGLERRVGCVCVVKDHKDGSLDSSRVVVVSSSKRPGEWIIPAGHVEKGEDPDVAAEREAFEEAGVRGTIVSFLVSEKDKIKNTLTDYYLIAVDALEDDFPEQEHRRVFLLDFEDVLRAIFSESVRKAVIEARTRVASLGP